MILEQIVQETRERVQRQKQELAITSLWERIGEMPKPTDLAAAISRPNVSIIAEIKRASPSRGSLSQNLDPRETAKRYAQGGVAAISVLTEPRHFRGALTDLMTVKHALAEIAQTLPVLRKDFIIDPYQLVEARAFGADAVLLIVAALDDDQLCLLYQTALELELTPLVEVHSEEEIRRALYLDPILLGINNRDLHTFEVNLNTTKRLRPLVPPGCLVVAESGIHSCEDMRFIASVGVNAALVGEALVTAQNPLSLLRQLSEAGQWS